MTDEIRNAADTQTISEINGAAYPLIVCQVPHQMPPTAWAIRTESEFYQHAIDEGGDNWEFPGHYERDDPDDPGDWIDTSTESDWQEAIAHDCHCCYFIYKDDYKEWNPGSPHQAIAARAGVDKIAEDLGWK